jgi:hypothetical protein
MVALLTKEEDMQYFKLVEKGIPVENLLDEVEAHSQMWYVDTSRQEVITKQRETHAITLRSHAPQANIDSRIRRAKPFGYKGQLSEMAADFPLVCRYVDDLVQELQGTPGRVVMTKLRPHGKIYPHTDDGLYWLLRDRYHLVLKSPGGSHFKAGGEEVYMREGELWWFDPTVEHEAFNESDDDRIHVIVDVLSPQSRKTFMKRLQRAPLRSLRAFFDAAVRGIAWPIRRRFFAADQL